MTSPSAGPAGTPPPWRRLVKPAAVALLLVVVLLSIRSAIRSFDPFGAVSKAAAGKTTVTQAVVVGKMKTVAQLVTSETTVRDVVTYENRRFGARKSALVVVTGRVLAGIDLDRGTEVKIDHGERIVRVTLPAATVLGVEITEMRTYDESSGIFNRFRPADRDTIFQLAREQLVRSASETGALEHANTSARRILEALISADGYTTEIVLKDASGRPVVSEQETPPR